MVIILHRGIQENILKVLFNLVKMPQFHYLKAATEFHKTLRIAIFFAPCLFIFKKSKIQGFSQTFRYIEKAKRLYIACFLDMLFFFQESHDALLEFGNNNLQILVHVTKEGVWKNPVLLKILSQQPVETEEGKLKTILTTEGGFSSKRIKNFYGLKFCECHLCEINSHSGLL